MQHFSIVDPKVRGSLAEWFFINALTKAEKKGALKIEPGLDTITFQVNGIDLDFIEVMGELHQRMQEMIEAKALVLVEQKLNFDFTPLQQELDEAHQRVIDKVQALVAKVPENAVTMLSQGVDVTRLMLNSLPEILEAELAERVEHVRKWRDEATWLLPVRNNG